MQATTTCRGYIAVDLPAITVETVVALTADLGAIMLDSVVAVTVDLVAIAVN